MGDCVFCSIARNEVPGHMVWEDDSYVAFLDIFPNTVGQTLVIPREHRSSYLFDLPDGEVQSMMKAARHVASMLEKALGVPRVNLVFEGLEIDHLHAKLYPVHGLASKFESIVPKETVNFDRYPGYVSTLHGRRASSGELDRLAEKIRLSGF